MFFTKKTVSNCVWHVLVSLGWCGSFYAVKKQVSVAPRCFTLFHVLCMLLKLFRSFNLFKWFVHCCTFFGGWCFWVVTRLDHVVLGYRKLISSVEGLFRLEFQRTLKWRFKRCLDCVGVVANLLQIVSDCFMSVVCGCFIFSLSLLKIVVEVFSDELFLV